MGTVAFIEYILVLYSRDYGAIRSIFAKGVARSRVDCRYITRREEIMKKVVIIGAGVSGLTAGIYLQKAGFETEIYEKNAISGGQCTGWNREGYHIDNCIHWLTGTKKETELYTLWETVGVLGETIELVQMDKFYSIRLQEGKITLWRDLEKTRQEMIQLSPEDQVEIDKFIEFTKLSETISVPVEKPFDKMNLFDYMKLSKSMSGILKVFKEYRGMNIEDLANRFHHPLLQKAIKEYMPSEYQAYALLVSYASVTSGNGDIPRGGSLAMANRMVKKYIEYGGKIYNNNPVDKVIIDGKKAVGIQLLNQTKILSDYVICACDINHTFEQLLDKKYMPRDMQKIYKDRQKYPLISGFQIAFALDGEYELLSGTNFFECLPFRIAEETVEYMNTRSYEYEPSFAPVGKSILQCNFMQSEKSYEYWDYLYKNESNKYKKEKINKAEQVLDRIIQEYPFLEGKIKILDIWTPVTYHRYCNSFYGSYMGFIISKHAKDQRTKGRVKGLSNVMLASQWLMGPGGLPVAAAMGKFSAQRIIRFE